MRSRRPALQKLRSLNPEDKIMAISAFVAFIGCFLPWYESTSRFGGGIWNGFEKIGAVGGYLISVMALGVIAFILLPLWDIKPKLPWNTESILLQLTGQMAFLGFIFLLVFTQYASMDTTTSSSRFGIYMVIAASLISFLAALLYDKNAKRKPFALRQDEIARIPRHHKPLDSQYHQESGDLRERDRENSEAQISEPAPVAGRVKDISFLNRREEEDIGKEREERQSFNF